MINVSAATVQIFITHQVGNRLQDEEVVLSSAPSTIDPETENLFLQYLLSSFKPEEAYQFWHPTELALNEVYTVAGRFFDDARSGQAFVDASQDLAKLLYESSMHPKIKDGKLNVVYFNDVLIDDETFDAIGIFKSETDVPFLQMRDDGPRVEVRHQKGYEIKGIDKGCLIVNTDREDGFQVLVIDKRGTETRYWVDEFLKVKPLSTSYQQTQQAMSLTRNFIAKQVPKDFEIEKTEQMSLLNKSAEFFGKKEKFRREEFEEEILQDENLIQAFRTYNDQARAESSFGFDDEFDISSQAYKKQSKIFKSILKLDRNFHVYIHGDKDLIEKGVDAQGRKYYKLYYSEER